MENAINTNQISSKAIRPFLGLNNLKKLLLVLFVVSPCLAADWQFQVENNDETARYYADLESWKPLEKDGECQTWIKVENVQAGKVIDHAAWLTQFNCSKKEARIVTVVEYDSKDKIVNRYGPNYEEKWKVWPAKSVMDLLLDQNCDILKNSKEKVKRDSTPPPL
jgi:hypothetical protein